MLDLFTSAKIFHVAKATFHFPGISRDFYFARDARESASSRSESA